MLYYQKRKDFIKLIEFNIYLCKNLLTKINYKMKKFFKYLIRTPENKIGLVFLFGLAIAAPIVSYLQNDWTIFSLLFSIPAIGFVFGNYMNYIGKWI